MNFRLGFGGHIQEADVAELLPPVAELLPPMQSYLLLNCITSNLVVTLKGKNLLPKGGKFFPLRVAPNEGGDGLRLSHEKVHLFPS